MDTKKTLEREFTATAYIVQDEKLLLIHHRKFGKWLPPGGHLDPNETPPECAKREAREETGLEIELWDDTILAIDLPNAHTIERPFICLLEQVPPIGITPAHQHVDFIFIARPVGGFIKANLQETKGIGWFSLQEINKMTETEDTFPDISLNFVKIIDRLCYNGSYVE